VSKLFELLPHIETDNYYDADQFGFTTGSSTTLCTSVLFRLCMHYVTVGPRTMDSEASHTLAQLYGTHCH